MPSQLRDRLPWGALRVRLAVWNTAVVLATVVAALLAARYAARATLYEQADRELRGGVREVILALQDLFPDMDAVTSEMRRKAASHEERGWFTQLLEEDGTPIWKSEHCPEAVAKFPPHNLDRTENIVQVGPYRYVRLRIAQPGQPVFHVRVGTYTTGVDASLSALMRLLLLVGFVLCALTPFAGWWLAVQSTRPVADILATADRLDPARLDDRLPVRGARDELDHLAETINGLLDDVADHVDRQQQFVADAAHELRGPLAAVQSSIEVALAGDREPSDQRETLEEVLDETRYLSKLADGLLMLAETGAAPSDTGRSPVDLRGIASQAVAMFVGVGEDRGITVRMTTPDTGVVVAGDADQLRQVVGNLLDNAIRFTPVGGTVDVGVELDASGAVLTVTDTGTGIAARHLPRIFDRFYKVDDARARDGGARSGGLGLPICKSIVDRHGGTISLASREGAGTTVTVRLPALSQAKAPAAPGVRQPVGAVAAR